jgi:integrase/recombinase XerD
MNAISKSELLALLRAARAHCERDWLMILTTFWHGLRASEVIALTPNDLRDGHITAVRLKGSRKTVQPLISHRNALLNEKKSLFEYTRGMTGVQRIFPISRMQFWRIVAKHARAAGIPKHKAHPHMLKHTCAMSLISKVGIENARQWLGHRSMSSTGEYLKVSDEEAGRAILASLKD